MKARITHLKAPWPLGARVGDVVELDSEPAWAVGKFEKVGDDEPVTLEFGEPVLVELSGGDASEVEGLKAAIADLTAKLEAADLAALQHAEAAQVAQAAVQSADATIAGLNEQLLLASQEAEAAKASAAELTAQVADLTAKLEASQGQAQAQAKTGKK